MSLLPTPQENNAAVVLASPGSTAGGTNESALYSPSDNADGVYDDCVVNNHYDFDENIFMLPITSPEGTTGAKNAFVCMSESVPTIWIADWSISKRGVPPKVPTWQTSDPNVKLLRRYIDPHMLQLMGDGNSVVYRLSGTYIYGFIDPEKAKMYHGRPPWMSQAVNMKVNEQFVKGIISP